MRRHALFLAAVTLAALSTTAAAAPKRPSRDGMTVADHLNLEQNLRWILARERAASAAGAQRPTPVVAVLADVGQWHLGARSLVEALEGEGIACRVLDATALTPANLKGMKALVIPGGWAYFVAAGLGDEAPGVIRTFVEGGGTCLGVCAGGFLLARTIAWEGARYDYGYGLFDGVAEGPLPALAPWPKRGPVRLTPSDAGKKRGLGALGDADVLYFGGPRFLGGTDVEVLAAYPDGTAALVARRVGKGEILLTGPHLERPVPAVGNDASPPPAQAGKLLRALLGL
jgi:glutamine amidotransferase-like uncharacterized protein